MFVEMEAPLSPRILKIGAPSQNKLVGKWNPKKLAAVVSQLCCAFDERDKRHREKCGSTTAVKSPLPANPALSRASLPKPTA